MRRPSSWRRSFSHASDLSTPARRARRVPSPTQNRNAADLSAAFLSFRSIAYEASAGLNVLGRFVVRAGSPDVRRKSRRELRRMSAKDHDPDWLILLRVRRLLHMMSTERSASPERAGTRAPKAA